MMTLYHYDHCPYCAKARMIFGLKNIPMQLVALANDNEITPVELIGKKMLPILIKPNGRPLPESLDIIKYIDEIDSHPIVSYTNPRPEIATWLKSARQFYYHLAMPRWIQMPLPEFASPSARDYFQRKKEQLSIGSFAEALEQTQTYKTMAETAMMELQTYMLPEPTPRFYVDKVHIDDFHLFATLRILTTVKDLKWPPGILKYVKDWSAQSKVNLFLDYALP